MIDLKLVREDPDAVRRSQLSRGEDPALVDALLAADTNRRAAISVADTLRAEQKTASKSVGSASAAERPALLEHAKSLTAGVKEAEAAQGEAEAAFVAAHMSIPNIIIDGVPAGGEDDYAVLEVVGETPTIDEPKDHLDLGESLRLIDMERGAKVSGSRFYFLTGYGALLQLGIMQLAVRLATDAGFTLKTEDLTFQSGGQGGAGGFGNGQGFGASDDGQRPTTGGAAAFGAMSRLADLTDLSAMGAASGAAARGLDIRI